MKRRTAIILFVIFVLIIVFLSVLVYSYYSFIRVQDDYLLNETFTLANWNLQIFGDKKANETKILDYYAEHINYYDVVFLQEIRDKDGSSFNELCARLPDYRCMLSSRAGRSSSKEQYGILYLKKFNLSIVDFNPDVLDRWERPPILASLVINNYSVNIYNIHTKPDDTPNEIRALEEIIVNDKDADVYKNMIILGDLNADCNYYNPYSEKTFDNWHWIITNDDDTTSTNSDCAYDRIIMNSESYSEFLDYGIEKTEYSDHYLVWVRIRQGEYSKDKSISGFIKQLIK